MSLSVNDYTKYNLYNIFLMTKNNFNISQLRKAYQRQILIYHPDKFTSDMSEEEKKEKLDAFHLINNSYTILTNDELKKEYDTKRDIIEMEDQNFIQLKSKFLLDKDKYKLTTDELQSKKNEITELFQKQMDEMNLKIQEQLTKEQLVQEQLTVDDLAKLQINRDQETSNIISSTSTNKQLLESTTITPLEPSTFTEELSNMNTNRNIKLENTSQEYTGLYSNYDDEKYASFDKAYS